MTGAARQPHPFDPRKAAALDDADRERWLPSDVVVELLDAPSKARILDFGTGTARYAIRIAQALPGAAVTAFDAQEAMLQLARRRVRESAVRNVHVAGPDDAALRSRFDRVLALNVLHEVDDEALKLIRISLKPDGVALFIDWDSSIKRDVGPPREHVYSVLEAQERLKHAQFDVSSTREPRLPYHYVVRAVIAQ